MAVIPGGAFFGYREIVLPAVPAGRFGLGFWGVPGRVPHIYEAHEASAPDVYGDMTVLQAQSAILLIQTWDEAALFQLSADASTYQDEMEMDPEAKKGARIDRKAIRGFRVKNKTAGKTARYQVVAFR